MASMHAPGECLKPHRGDRSTRLQCTLPTMSPVKEVGQPLCVAVYVSGDDSVLDGSSSACIVIAIASAYKISTRGNVS